MDQANNLSCSRNCISRFVIWSTFHIVYCTEEQILYSYSYLYYRQNWWMNPTSAVWTKRSLPDSRDCTRNRPVYSLFFFGSRTFSENDCTMVAPADPCLSPTKGEFVYSKTAKQCLEEISGMRWVLFVFDFSSNGCFWIIILKTFRLEDLVNITAALFANYLVRWWEQLAYTSKCSTSLISCSFLCRAFSRRQLKLLHL